MMVLDPVLSLTVALLIAFVFARAGMHKVMQYSRHVEIVADYRVAPRWLVPLLAPLVIIVEFAAAVLALWPATRSLGLALAAGLLLVYVFAIGLNLLRGRTSIDCGCAWGSQGQRISAWLLLRNILLLGVSLAAIAPMAQRSLHVLDWLLTACASLAVIVVYVTGDLLIANWSKLSQLNPESPQL
jgi:hypothetical protein